MFRPRLLLHKIQVIQSQRLFCNANAKGKCYIIKTKDQGKIFVYENEILQKFRERTEQQKPRQNQMTMDTNCWNLERLMRAAHQLMLKSHQQSISLMRQYRVQEKLIELRKTHILKINGMIAEVPQLLREQMIVIRSSDGYKRATGFHHQIVPYAIDGIFRARRLLKTFAESRTKACLDEIFIWFWVNGKLYSVKIFKFIKEAYFEKPNIQPKKT